MSAAVVPSAGDDGCPPSVDVVMGLVSGMESETGRTAL